MTSKFQNLGLMTCLGTSLFASAAEKQKKNILIVMSDDFNYWTKLQGYYPQVKTPNIDKLASKGIFFSDAQCSSPVSNPSRNALWSGFRPSTTGIIGNDYGYIRDTPGFENIVTMNQYFKNNGYWLYGAGKLYHAGFGTGDNTEVDIANWSAFSNQFSGCAGGDFLSWQSPDDPAFKYSVNPDPLTDKNCGDHKIALDAASVITNYSTSANKDKPFFIACGFLRPHLPWNVPKQFYDLFKTDTIQIPKGYKSGDLLDTGEGTTATHTGIVAAGKWKEAIHMYLAALALSDYNAGVVLDALEKTSYKDNTIVVFMGDHGWHLGEKERWGKASVWDASGRTTLVIYDPSAKGNGQICKKVVSLQDLYPTLVEMSGLPIKTDIEGNSIAALFENPAKTDWNKPVIATRQIDKIKTDKWCYVRDANSTSKNMLYDVENDPYEFDNLYKIPQYASVISRLNTQLDSMINIGNDLKTKLLVNYKFVPKVLTIPGILEAEDYDEGGYTQTYYDADKVNSGGQYRTTDGTDIYITDDSNGSYHLGGLSAGDWCKYTVTDYLEGNYNVDFRIKNTGASPAVIQLFNRSALLAEVIIPVVNGWQTIRAPQIVLDNQASTRLQIKVKSGSGLQLNSMAFELISSLNSEISANISRKTILNSIVTEGILYLNLQTTDPVTKLSIYDMNGKLMSNSKVPGEQNVAYTLPIRLNSGVYFLRITDELAASVEQFIIR